MTEANFVFMLPDGQIIATIERFSQRLIEFPQPLARIIFGGEAADLSQAVINSPAFVERQINLDDWSILTESWGIWSRALAHLILSAQERALWLDLPEDVNMRSQWLLKRLVVKESIRSWIIQQGIQPPDISEIEIDMDQNIHVTTLLDQQLNFELTSEKSLLIARVST